MNSIAIEKPIHSQDPPITWTNEEPESALSKYLAYSDAEHSVVNEWKLFSLCVKATQARIANHFEQLMCLEHIHGFTPLAHQIRTAERVLRDLHGRAILADEVGLGKTIEAGLIIKEYQLRGLAKKILILVPASLVLQWTRELQEKFRIQATAQKNVYSWQEYDVIIASLDTAKREPHQTQILNQEWDLLVVDEAHKLKNKNTKNWKMVNQIANKYLLLLTATPMQNQLQELHTLITLLKPGQLGNRQEFSAKHVQSKREPKSTDVLQESLFDVMIRNRKSEGSTALPKRHVQVVPLELNTAERELYESVQDFLKTEYHSRKQKRQTVLPLLTLQREICSSPYAALISLEKMLKKSKSPESIHIIQNLMHKAEQITHYTKVEKVLEMMQQINHKCIIFTEYRATQEFLLYMLKKRGITAVPFRGGFKKSKKDWMQDLFERKMQVLVATESGGEGINLQFCNQMINFDLPWNPMRLEQRIGRIHRLGQTQECYIYNLATSNTIEEHIVRLLHEKIRMFELVIGELDMILTDKDRQNFEQKILEFSLTSQSNDELKSRLEDYGNRLLTKLPIY